MRRAVATVAILALASAAEAGPKRRDVARLASGASAAVAGSVVLGGFLFAQDGRPFNEPVLYSGLGLLFVAPSAGEFYAGQYLTVGMGIRAGAAGLAVYTLTTQVKDITCANALSSDQDKCTGFKENAYPLLGVAAIAFIGGVWYDVLDAGDAADRYNRAHGFSVTATPTALRSPQGLAPGLALSGRF